MKRKFMRIISILMVLVMTLGMCVTGWAADDVYTITVENSMGGAEYKAYKIFDAQIIEGSDAVSYSIDSASPWFSAVSSSDIFKLTQYGDTTWHVELVFETADADVIEFLNKTYGSISEGLTADAQAYGTGGAIDLELTEAGYYYVTTSSGSSVSVTTTNPDATIKDKNQKPGGGDDAFKKYADDTPHSVGDTVTYTVTAYVPTYDGEEQIGTYTFTDKMGKGLIFESITSVTITGYGLEESGMPLTYPNEYDFNYDSETGTLTISYTIVNESGEEVIENYPADATITIVYTATVNDAADETDLTNDIGLSWTKVSGDEGGEIPPEEGPGSNLYIYGFDLRKVDSTTQNVLSGAEFTLKNEGSDDLITFLYDTDSDTYEVWDNSTEGTTTTTITVGDGEVNIWGLGEGKYILTETKAPDGYNLLAEPITVEITAEDNGWTVTLTGAVTGSSHGAFTDRVEETDTHGIAIMAGITVENATGTVLPGTGGIGTTIFYIVGALLVLAGAALIVARMRLGKTE